MQILSSSSSSSLASVSTSRPRFDRAPSLPSNDNYISIIISDLSTNEAKKSKESLAIDATEQIEHLDELIGELEEEICKRNSWIEFFLRDSESDLAGFDPASFENVLRDFFDVLDVVKEKFELSEKTLAAVRAKLEEKDHIISGKEEHIQIVEKENGRLLKKIQEAQKQINLILEAESDCRLTDLLQMLGQKCDRVDVLEQRLRKLNRLDSLDYGGATNQGLPEVSSDSDLYEKIMRLEQRLERMQSKDQSSDLDHYVRKLEKHNESLEKQKASLSDDLESARSYTYEVKVADREMVLQWFKSNAPEVERENAKIQGFLSELKEECECLRKVWQQYRKQATVESMDAVKVFPGLTSISLLEQGFSFDFDDHSDVMSTSSFQSMSPHSPVERVRSHLTLDAPRKSTSSSTATTALLSPTNLRRAKSLKSSKSDSTLAKLS